jgi:hypothetical protein
VRTISAPLAVAATFAGALLVAAPAQAVTFATFTQTGTARTIHWVRDANMVDGAFFTGPNVTTHASVGVRFNFQLDDLSDFAGLASLFTVDATEVGMMAGFEPTTQGITQTHVDGPLTATGFSIIYNGPAQVLNGHAIAAGANLLSGRYSNIWLQGVSGANAGSAADSDPTPGSITFTSDFLNFTGSTDRGFSWDLTSVNPLFAFEPGRALPSFNASVTGSFSAELPGPGTHGGVPEAEAWVLMILGFGASGAVLRRRRALLA